MPDEEQHGIEPRTMGDNPENYGSVSIPVGLVRPTAASITPDHIRAVGSIAALFYTINLCFAHPDTATSLAPVVMSVAFELWRKWREKKRNDQA